jgi:threonyl-tRNA synthetase
MAIGGILHRSTEVLIKAIGGLGINFIQENDVVLLGNMTVGHMEDKLKLKQQCGHIQV